MNLIFLIMAASPAFLACLCETPIGRAVCVSVAVLNFGNFILESNRKKVEGD